jgi:hypothetical protein
LSGTKRSESDRAAPHKRSPKSAATDRKGRKQRSVEFGRALRSIYDDTVRETVPDDFVDLLGKLS